MMNGQHGLYIQSPIVHTTAIPGTILLFTTLSLTGFFGQAGNGLKPGKRSVSDPVGRSHAQWQAKVSYPEAIGRLLTGYVTALCDLCRGDARCGPVSLHR